MLTHTSETLDPFTLISPETPRGFSTVAEWWLTQERNAFDLLEDPLATLEEEEKKAFALCRKIGEVERHVAPSPRAAAMGLKMERAYPLWVLERLSGDAK